MKTLGSFEPSGKKILAISAHPDDADFFAGGTLIKWMAAGAKAAIAICTNGDKGSQDQSLTSTDLAKIRQSEQLAASEFLGLEQTWFLDYPDAHLELTQELKGKLSKIIREYRPDAVFTFDPTAVYSVTHNMINHPDHRCVGQATLDAVYPMARDHLTFPSHLEEGLEPHAVGDIFLYNFDNPNFFVDISETIGKKNELLGKHPSQFDIKKVEGWVREWNSETGKQNEVSYAEAFVHLSLK